MAMSSELLTPISLGNMITMAVQNCKRDFLLTLEVLSSPKVLGHPWRGSIALRTSTSRVTLSSLSQSPRPTWMRSWRYRRITWYHSAVRMPCRLCAQWENPSAANGIRKWSRAPWRTPSSDRIMSASQTWLRPTTTQSRSKSSRSWRTRKIL